VSKRRATRPRRTRAEAIERLEELYAQLPSVTCRGLCHDTCTSIDASELERERLRERGVVLPARVARDRLRTLIAEGRTPRCPALSALNTCSVYAVRPLICRGWGAVYPGLLCEHGCVPDGDMDDGQFFQIMLQVEELSVDVTGVSRVGHGRR
jgi:Fe-S-cluster containining protein